MTFLTILVVLNGNFCEKKCKPQIKISKKYIILNQKKKMSVARAKSQK